MSSLEKKRIVDTMMSPPSRGQSHRTPPFVLIGVFVVVCFLCFKYWCLTSENKNLQSEIERLKVQSGEMTFVNENAKIVGDHLRQELSMIRNQVDEFKKKMNIDQEAIREANMKRAEIENNVLECQQLLNTCSESGAAKEQKINILKDEAASMKEQAMALKTENAQKLAGVLKECKQSSASITGNQNSGLPLPQPGNAGVADMHQTGKQLQVGPNQQQERAEQPQNGEPLPQNGEPQPQNGEPQPQNGEPPQKETKPADDGTNLTEKKAKALDVFSEKEGEDAMVGEKAQNDVPKDFVVYEQEEDEEDDDRIEEVDDLLEKENDLIKHNQEDGDMIEE